MTRSGRSTLFVHRRTVCTEGSVRGRIRTLGTEVPAPRKVSIVNERSARAILGVPASATAGEIKRAYRRLALERHPDRGGDPIAFAHLAEAHELLIASAPTSTARWVTPADAAAVPTTFRAPRRLRPTSRTAVPTRTAPQPRRFADVLAEKLAAA